MSTAFLDLAGVLLLGLVTTLAVALATGGPVPNAIAKLLPSADLSVIAPPTTAVLLAAIAALLLVAKSIINIFLTRRVLRFLANRQASVSGTLAAGLLSWPLLQVQRRSSQETAYALTNGVSAATLIILGQGVVALTESALLAVLALGLIWVSPVVTVFAVAFFAVVAVLLQRLLSDWAGRLGVMSSNADVDSYVAVQEAIQTYREITVANRRPAYVLRFQGLRWTAASVQADLQFIGLIPKYVFEVALILGAGLLAASQFMTKDVETAMGVIVVFLAAGSRVVPSMMRLQGATMSIRSAAGQAQPTFELADDLRASSIGAVLDGSVTLSSVPGVASNGDFDSFSPTVEVRNVTLTYPGATSRALTDVSLETGPGTSIALVGSTGAGKSTLADVILGIVAPDSGEVLLGGAPPLDAVITWPGAIAYVPQEVVMTSGTVRDNVALGLDPNEINDDLVWEALERAHLDVFLRSHREGILTNVGERGIRLSGGQRQRLGVARALYTRPKLLVLDEATSALDSETEKAIAHMLREMSGAVTTVTIAHRLATIRHCDQVVFLERGTVVARGTFDEVRQQSTAFDRQAQLLGL